MPRRTAYLIPLIVGLGLIVALWVELRAEQDRHAQEERLGVFYKLSAIQGRFEDGLNSRQQLAEAIRSFVMLNPDMDQQTFVALMQGLVSGGTGFRRVELARSNAISHVYPGRSYSLLNGKQLLHDFPIGIRKLVARAMEERQRQLTTPISVLGGGEVIVSATPIYLPKMDSDGTAPYWGMVQILIDADTLYREAGLSAGAPTLEIGLRSSDDSGKVGTMLHGAASVFDSDPVVMNIPIPNGFWQLAAIPAGGWSLSPNWNVILYGGGAVVFAVTSLLLATVYFLLAGIKEREKYRYLVQNAKSIILRMDVVGNITFCNEYAEKFFGFEPGELIGKSLFGSILPEKSLDGKPTKRFFSKLLKTPEAYLFNENVNIRKNGEMVWVAWANEPVKRNDGTLEEILCVGTDITDRKKMEEALKQSERQYRLLAENITDIIMGLDADRRFTYVSPSDEALRGFGRHEVLSYPIVEFLTPSSQRVFNEAMDNLLTRVTSEGNPPSTILDLEFTCADESTIWLETRFGLLLNDDRELIGMQGVGRDISDRKRAEALRDDVERMARHDLKTPLGAVIGLPEEIRSLGGLSATQIDMLATIEEAGDDMLELINRSLDLFKMESGTYNLQKSSTNVLRILDTIKRETRTIVREKGVSVGVDVENPMVDGEFRVFAEESLFKSMLANLMLNALQASPEGGTVTVFLSRGEDIKITIRNKGEVPKTLRETFFEKYVTGNDAGGSGIGTYSARLIARTHGGDISVDTCRPGETCVTITLPR